MTYKRASEIRHVFLRTSALTHVNRKEVSIQVDYQDLSNDPGASCVVPYNAYLTSMGEKCRQSLSL